MSEKVTMFKGDDPELLRANKTAQDTFKYFWRELFWERRRIIPALDYAMIKAAFHDNEGRPDMYDPSVEHMWVNDIVFDGDKIEGILINAPNHLKSVKKGDRVSIPLERLGDWIYCISGVAYGAFTVNVMRAKMSNKERNEHDSAWGVDFGKPGEFRITRKKAKKTDGIISSIFGKKAKDNTAGIPEVFEDHPMCVNMIPKYEEQIKANPSILESVDKKGWTLLHHEALAGNLATVKLFLKYNMDANIKTIDGKKASDLAAVLKWDPIVEVLKTAGA